MVDLFYGRKTILSKYFGNYIISSRSSFNSALCFPEHMVCSRLGVAEKIKTPHTGFQWGQAVSLLLGCGVYLFISGQLHVVFVELFQAVVSASLDLCQANTHGIQHYAYIKTWKRKKKNSLCLVQAKKKNPNQILLDSLSLHGKPPLSFKRHALSL